MFERNDANASSRDEGAAGQVGDYLARAVAACEAGDARLGMHLYLAAFEEASEESDVPSEDVIMGLKQAWRVACTAKERALAEYIYERLEPYLTCDEMDACAEQLQTLAFDCLEELGIPREEIEELTALTVQDFLGAAMASAGSDGEDAASAESGPMPSLPPLALPPIALRPGAEKSGPAEGETRPVEILTYETAAGFATAIERMRALGIGLDGDPGFDELVAMLNARHGFETRPSPDSLLFCSPAREDASRFMLATAGELGLPTVRMHMEENFQGATMLCVSAQASDAASLAALRRGFEGGGVLVLEDLDLWGAPINEATDDMAGLIMAAMSRGAREAINLIHQAVENPEVHVLASAYSAEAVDPFFLDVLFPLTCIDIDNPTEAERDDIWMDLARRHPSLRALRRQELVRLSAGMPRYDIYLAVREALEEAYKQGLVERRYQPVTRENLFDKLAAYQPLESPEYAELENTVISEFSAGLDELEDLLP